jgi:Flp pilus assembly secretin CpaC
MSIRACLLTVTLLSMAATPSHSTDGGIQVTMNQAKIVKLSRPADTIVVGNPEIADASIQDASTIVLTGRGFGTTNFVVMDQSGNAIIDETIFVSRGDAGTMRIYRRAEVQTLSCTPTCESAYKTEAERTSDEESATANKSQ